MSVAQSLLFFPLVNYLEDTTIHPSYAKSLTVLSYPHCSSNHHCNTQLLSILSSQISRLHSVTHFSWQFCLLFLSPPVPFRSALIRNCHHPCHNPNLSPHWSFSFATDPIFWLLPDRTDKHPMLRGGCTPARPPYCTNTTECNPNVFPKVIVFVILVLAECVRFALLICDMFVFCMLCVCG